MSLTEKANDAPGIEDPEGKPYAPPAPPPAEAWLTRAKAAKALGVSRSTLGNKVRAGKIVSRVEDGIRLFAVGAGAAKALVAAKEKASEGRDELAIVEAFAAGAPVDAIVTELRCSPRVLARTLRDLQSALAVAREIRQQQRDADEAERVREIELGHPDVPTTWAWCDHLFKEPAGVTYADARKKFDAWVEAGNAVERASPYVRQAVESPEAWLVARRLWSAEVQRAADRKARETILEDARVRAVLAREEAAQRSREAAATRRTAALVKASSGGGRKRQSTRSTEKQMDASTKEEYDGRSTRAEEGPV